MQALTYSHARANLAQTMKDVCNNHNQVIVTRKDDKNIVMMSLEDFNAWKETIYLLGNPNNAKRLIESINEYKAGKAKQKELIEC